MKGKLVWRKQTYSKQFLNGEERQGGNERNKRRKGHNRREQPNISIIKINVTLKRLNIKFRNKPYIFT